MFGVIPCKISAIGATIGKSSQRVNGRISQPQPGRNPSPRHPQADRWYSLQDHRISVISENETHSKTFAQCFIEANRN